ncbi:hypothetical protein EVAR_4989_1 [Eumeta japonica]|uniref:Uncharacterized protein n=1 Tax=Eumeta variegata TaxID=151549 RepID=A0A4C1UZS6_EUMVA|nr:hypothetical protein EVAR_4989_1 [Eumeta japonica]
MVIAYALLQPAAVNYRCTYEIRNLTDTRNELQRYKIGRRWMRGAGGRRRRGARDGRPDPSRRGQRTTRLFIDILLKQSNYSLISSAEGAMLAVWGGRNQYLPPMALASPPLAAGWHSAGARLRIPVRAPLGTFACMARITSNLRSIDMDI